MRIVLFGFVAALLILPRLVLLSLPGLGRDEAAYLYWARHPEFSYSPLLALALRATDTLPGPATPWLLRLPGFVAGAAGLWLLHRLSLSLSIPVHTRRFLLLALGLSPWWIYVGSLIHPDAWLLPALLGAAWAAREARRGWLVLACVVAAWAKPTGLLVLPLGLSWLLWRDRGTPAARATAGVILLLSCLPVLLSMRLSLLDGVREFSQLAPGVGWGAALSLGSAAFLLLCGPALLLAGFPRHRRRILEPTQFLALSFGIAFGVALLAWSQVKASWILPAWTLSALSQRASMPDAWKRIALAGSALCSLALVLGLTQPERVASWETRLPALAGWYLPHAGAREARVSSTTRWSDRAREYRGVERFAAELRASWGDARPPVWIVSDDYGLSAQLLAAWPAPETRMLLADDDVFRTEAEHAGESTLVLSVRRGRATQWVETLTGRGSVAWLASLPHPTAKGSVWVGRWMEERR